MCGSKFISLLAIALAVGGYCCGVSSVTNCQMVEFPPNIPIGPTIRAGIFGYRTKGVLNTDDNLWIVDVCRAYTDIQDDLGFDYETDRLMLVLQNVSWSILAIGAVFILVACCAPCFSFPAPIWKVTGLAFCSLSVLQGCTLMILNSAVCLNNPVLQYLTENFPELRDNYDDSCEWGMGFRLGISATVFWGIAGCVALASVPPKEEIFDDARPGSERRAAAEIDQKDAMGN